MVNSGISRRDFGLLVGLAAFAAVKRASAQATPAATPQANPDQIPINHQEGFVRSVSRSFELADPGFADVFTGSLFGIFGIGIEFDTRDNASQSLRFLEAEFPRFIENNARDDEDFIIEAIETSEVGIGLLGDERKGISLIATLGGNDFFEEVSYAVCLVRKENLLQALVGYSIVGAMTPTIEITVTLDERWPSDDLGSTVPELADVPAGMTIDEEEELFAE